LRKGYASATFLPQVWEQLPDPAAFLSNLCLKAGLAADTWRHTPLEVETYQVQHFEEE
jgi:AMMECR1 domain-containing protein